MVMMIAAAAHLSWCAELSRSTDAHQARLGRMELLLLLQAAGPTPGRISQYIAIAGKRANLQSSQSNMAGSPGLANTQSPRQNKAGAADLASIAFVVFDLAPI